MRSNGRFLYIVVGCVLVCRVGYSQEFRYAEDVAPSVINPMFSKEMVEIRLNELMFSGLFKDSIFMEAEGDLAETWKVSLDKQRVEITLREKTWHDGKPVTAYDVAFTVQALKRANRGAREFRRVAAISKVEVLTPNKLVIEFHHNVSRPLKFLYFKIIPKHILVKLAQEGEIESIKNSPIGSGPFALDDFVANEIRLRRVVKSAGDDERILEIRALLAVPKSTQIEMLKFGYLEAIVRVPPGRIAEVRAIDSCRLYSYETSTWWYIGVNHANHHLAIRNVREAIVHALDRENIRQARLGGGKTISGPFAPWSPFYDSKVTPREFSLSSTERLMKKAGYHKKNGVFRDRNNRMLKLRMVLNMQWSLVLRDVALSLEAELRAAGFIIEVQWLDTATWFQAVERDHIYDITLGIWTFDEGSNIRPLFHSKGEKNFIGYRNQHMDKLFERVQEVRDPDILIAINRKLHRIAYDDLPYVFLWSTPTYSAISTKIYDVDIHPFTFFGSVTEWRYQK
ncbi:MAG: ABC transporter substrate-binding protein [Myxococcales bacterium]|nr:ABC transporter substrate-binding protein [Myxococcales bacterium]